jgi:hypothetical protein
LFSFGGMRTIEVNQKVTYDDPPGLSHRTTANLNLDESGGKQ